MTTRKLFAGSAIRLTFWSGSPSSAVAIFSTSAGVNRRTILASWSPCVAVSLRAFAAASTARPGLPRR
ncbi:MAG: hypothetical protein U0529_21170 [Thermoanaerobaculia bacterium]